MSTKLQLALVAVSFFFAVVLANPSPFGPECNAFGCKKDYQPSDKYNGDAPSRDLGARGSVEKAKKDKRSASKDCHPFDFGCQFKDVVNEKADPFADQIESFKDFNDRKRKEGAKKDKRSPVLPHWGYYGHGYPVLGH